jgi:hypothetical protein
MPLSLHRQTARFLAKHSLLAAIPLLFASCGSTPMPSPKERARPEALERTVRFLSDTLHGRGFDQPENLQRAYEFIQAGFAQAQIPCDSQVFSVHGRAYRNLFCKVVGRSDTLLILGAHYDTYLDLPGADDNASGVAGLLETARLVRRGAPPPYTTLFVAFVLEEPPYFRTADMGSHHFARMVHDSAWPLVGMTSIEMIGYFSDTATQDYPSAMYSLLYPSKGNFIAAISDLGSSDLADEFQERTNDLGDISCQQLSTAPSTPGVDFSDHLNFWKFGYPAFMVTNTSLYRNKAYHSRADTAGTLDYLKMAFVVDALTAFVQNKTP